jgi:hypothetical protein
MGWGLSRGSNLVTGPLGSVAGEPDRRQRQLLCPLSPLRTSGWRRLAGKAVRLFGPPAFAADASTSRGSACYLVHPAQLLEFSQPATVSEFLSISSLSQSFLGEEPRNGSEHYFLLRDLIFRGNYVTNRCPDLADRMYPLPQAPKMDLGS